MGVNGIEVDGQFTNTPDVYGQANATNSVGNAAPFKNIVLVGDFPYLEPKKPKRVTSKESLEALMPGDLELLRKSAIIYGPARDDRVAGGPAEVWLINTRPTTQAKVQLVDPDEVPCVEIASKVWGPKGNQTYLTVTEDDSVFAISVQRGGTFESFGGVKGTPLFTLTHTSSLFSEALATLSSVELDSGTGNEFEITGSVASLPIGTTNFASHPIHGTVQITPSVAPGMGQSFTAIVTIVDQDGEDQVLTTLTWAAGEDAPKSTVVDAIALKSIVCAETGAQTPTFTVDCTLFLGTSQDYPTAASLAAAFQLPPYSSVYSVADVSSLAGQVPISQIDPANDVDIKAGFTFSNIKSAFVAALKPSLLVTATALEEGGAPDTVTNAKLVGGTAPPTQSTDWDAAFVAARLVPGRIYWADSDNASIHGKLRAHCIYMAGPGAYDCNGWVGADRQETKDELIARAQQLNTKYLSLVGQEIERQGPLGTLEWLSPRYLALLGASIQAGTREAVTGKIPDITNFRQHESWTPEADKTEMHNGRVTILGVGISDGGAQVRFLRALTTYFGSSDPCRTDVRPVESIAELMLFARPVFKPTIGGNTTAPREVIESVWKATLQRAASLGIIGAFDEKSAKAVRIGNVTTLRATVVPVFSNDFIKIEIGVVESLTGTGFQLQLAA